jgi:transposase
LMSSLHWLGDESWPRIEPLPPHGRRGARRVDDRRVILGIMQILRMSARWPDCPPKYGPCPTACNRFNRWRRHGVWQAIYYARRRSAGIVGVRSVSTDSAYVGRQDL